MLASTSAPATSLKALPDSWLRPPPPPSHFDPEIPASLDHLLAAMLSIGPEARPTQMGELTQRLGEMIGRRTPPVQAPQLNAHLVAPKLVGRSAECKLAVAYAARTQQGSGATLLITGESGLGRSRMLETFALEAKLAGGIALQVQANAAQDRRLGVIQDAIASLARARWDRRESRARAASRASGHRTAAPLDT